MSSAQSPAARLVRRFFGLVLGALDISRFHMRAAYYSTRLGGLGSDCRIYPNARIYNPRNVRIGDRVTLNDFVHLWGGGGIEIGSDTMIAAGTIISSQTHDVEAYSAGLRYRETNLVAPITIGKNVWIGSGAIILPGVTVGNDAVIGAGSIVTKDVPEKSVVAGNPARVLRHVGGSVETP